jgi:mRNA interferase RelE/StbE
MKSVIFKPRAAKSLGDIPEPARSKIRNAISGFANGAPADVKKLAGSAAWRLRVGSYRVVFDHDGAVLTILDIGSRQGVYKK